MLLYSGYNGFQQLAALVKKSDSTQLNDVVKEFYEIDISSENAIVSASWSSILLIKDDNTIMMCGFLNGKSGQCIHLHPPFKERIIQVSASKDGYYFVTENNQVWHFTCDSSLWKNLSHVFNAEVTSAGSARITKVKSGETLTVAMSDSGVAYCAPNVFTEVQGVIDVACGKEHGVLLTGRGLVLTWGGGSRGQLGRGCLEDCETPSEVEALSGLNVIKIAAGGWHSVAVTDEGDVYTWGWNKQGQLGFPILEKDLDNGVSVLSVPRAVELPDDDAFVEEVSCGVSHTVVKLKDGSILGCGWNKWGQLGLKGIKSCDKMTHLPATTNKSVQRIVCEAWSTFIFVT